MHCFVIKEFLEGLWVGVNEELHHFQQSKAVRVAKLLVEQLFSCKSYNCEKKKKKRIEQNGNHGGKILTTRQNNTLGSMGNLQSNPTLNNLENTHLTQEFVIKKSIFIGLAKCSNLNSIL